jgi:hypothetical protein
MVGGLAASALAALVAIAVLASQKDPGARPPQPPARPSPAASPLERAAAALREAETLAARQDLPADEVAARLENLLAGLRGTEQESKVSALLEKVRREADAARATKIIDPQIAALRADIQADADFSRYPEFRDRFQKLRDLAGTSAPARLPEIQKLQSEYSARYEKAAEPRYEQIREAATVLADERRYPDALKQIESFPEKFRHSRAWAGLQQLRADVERRAKTLPAKK